jgi:hypothetical protein
MAKQKQVKRKVGDRFCTFIGLESGRCAIFINEVQFIPDAEGDPRPREQRIFNALVGDLILPDADTAKAVAAWIR